MVIHILVRQRVNDRNRHAEQREELKEGLISLYSVVTITHTDYTQYINACNFNQTCHHNACSICLVTLTLCNIYTTASRCIPQIYDSSSRLEEVYH